MTATSHLIVCLPVNLFTFAFLRVLLNIRVTLHITFRNDASTFHFDGYSGVLFHKYIQPPV